MNARNLKLRESFHKNARGTRRARALGEPLLRNDVYPTNFIVDGKHDTGIGSPTFTTFPKGNYSLPGTPKIYFNEYLIYKFSNGFGIGLRPQVTGQQKANVSGTLTIPAQVTWNAEIFYR